MTYESDYESVGRREAVETVRDLYDVVRELTDSELIDLQDWRDAGGPMAGFADDISKALTRAADVLAAVYGPGAVK